MLPAYPEALSIGVFSLTFAEWGVHYYMLHRPKKKRNFLNRASSYAHHDVHHAAFMGPAHYYRDVTNEHETIHFSGGDVALILGVGGGAGFIAHKANDLVNGTSALNMGDLGAVAGMVTASIIGYAGYEYVHHKFHVIGPRRLAINRTLGDLLQEERDGKLRFTKPLLDDICNVIEEYVDKNAKAEIWPVRYTQKLEDRFNEQVVRNREELGNEIKSIPFNALLTEVASEMLERERTVREGLTAAWKDERTVRTGLTAVWNKLRYWSGRKTQKLFRGSNTPVGKYFRYIDNSHFKHHYNYTKNLNVFITLADYVFGTKIDSSSATLDQWKKNNLLCPNSPDEKPFVRPDPA